jgi:predicted Ser/Thr protein kinase
VTDARACRRCGATSSEFNVDCASCGAPLDDEGPKEDAAARLVGERVGRYRVLRVLGRGGMGIVYRAEDEALRRVVALKILPEALQKDEERRRRLLREARAAAAVQHPNIATVFDVGEDGGRTFVAMELVEGQSLRQVLKAGPLPASEAARLALGMARALAKAHERGVVHRDLKPENVMLDREGEVKILDFGLAKVHAAPAPANDTALTQTAELVTQEGFVIGTPGYMAPEQAKGKGVDARADVFSFGVVLYEMLAGERPFRGETALDVLIAASRDAPAPVSGHGTKDPTTALARVAERCLAKAPGDRYPDGRALVTALEALDTTHAAAHEAAPGRSRAPLWIGALAVAALGAAALVVPRWRGATSASTTASASATPVLTGSTGSRLACPPLEASGVEEPSGWLGAAAASLVCLRAQMRMGGHTARTLVPAELLDLPREPVDGFPLDPYGQPGARDRALAAAKARAAAYVDGRVTREGEEFRVALSLRSTDARELATGEGRGRILVFAVRAAMDALEASGAIPRAPDGDPFLHDWLRVRTADGAVALTEAAVTLCTEDVTGAGEECPRVAARADVLGDAVAFAKVRCAIEQTEPPPPLATATLDESTPGGRALSRLLRVESADPMPAPLRDDLHASRAGWQAAFDAEPAHELRALLAASEAWVAAADGDELERKLALVAIQEDPKVFHLVAQPWHELFFASIAAAQLRAHAGWVPWEPHPHSMIAEGMANPEDRVAHGRRAYLLAPSGFFATHFGETLLKMGRRDEARTFAARHGDDLLRLRVDAGDARFARVLEKVPSMLATYPVTLRGGQSAILVGAFAANVAQILGRPADMVDGVVTRFLDPDGPDVAGANTALLAIGMCTLAPPRVARTCVARLRALARSRKMSVQMQMDELLDGAERHANGDWAGAVRAWRPHLRTTQTSYLVETVRDAFATDAERTGDSDLAEKIDATALAQPGAYNGVDLAWVRAARRAAKRGDAALARKLAQQVVEAWQFADEVPPAVGEMRKLLGASR